MDDLSILFDHQAFEMQKFGGISRYIYELMRNLPIRTKLSLRVSTNYYLKSDSEYMTGIYLPERPYKWVKGLVKKMNRNHSIDLLMEGSYSLFHPTYYHPYFIPYLKGTPYVVTVHDMNYELFPQYFGNAEKVIAWKKETIVNATRIIAISNNTKRDLIRLLGGSPEKIDVIYHGITQVKTTYYGLKLPERYVLYVGDRGGYKNFFRFLEAFQQLASLDKHLYLICTGKFLNAYEWVKIENLGLKHRFIYMRANELELGQLYKQALLFVYPSMYEGFGIPILEAYLNGCPVALSDASCFPEIAGEAGAYFDPNDKESMIETIHKLLIDQECRIRLIEEGNKRLPRYTWEETVRKTLNTYEVALQQADRT